ncbi:hypothetical protein ACFS5L_14185 [Streptomyces phyllanthi]|uniref:DUF4280 domain-containing protein n=1 Tax=Streptomyces phyllanthi TaxID=1803180 RepID=A0A5N8W5P5_9ACTN|nr:hypothetical protein [Streptomyces phyllanthi]MPY42236.1 hypothetical protein [Streptomyces phyllanthi]
MSGTSGATGNLLAADTVISCPHGGRAVPAHTPSPAVLIGGRAAATAAHTYTVAGCAHTVSGVPQPCVSVRFTGSAGGVTAAGAPVLLDTSAAQCFSAALVAQGPPVVTAARQEVSVR